MWGLGGSNLNTSKPPAGCGWGRRGWHSPTSPCEGGSPQAVCMWGLGGGQTGGRGVRLAVGPTPQPGQPALFYLRWSLLMSQFRGIPQLLGTH